jgi:predicted nuclease of predicted toxin-antitoxin system
MRLFCDQNIPLETVAFLRSLGHDVHGTRDVALSMASDEDVLRFAIAENRVLVTYNADFSDLREFPPGTHAGIIRLRLAEQTAEILHPILHRAFQQLADKDLDGKLVTVSEARVRIRAQP